MTFHCRKASTAFNRLKMINFGILARTHLYLVTYYSSCLSLTLFIANRRTQNPGSASVYQSIYSLSSISVSD